MINKLKSGFPVTLTTHFKLYKHVYVLIISKKAAIYSNIYSSSESLTEEKSLKLSILYLITFS